MINFFCQDMESSPGGNGSLLLLAEMACRQAHVLPDNVPQPSSTPLRSREKLEACSWFCVLIIIDSGAHDTSISEPAEGSFVALTQASTCRVKAAENHLYAKVLELSVNSTVCGS